MHSSGVEKSHNKKKFILGPVWMGKVMIVIIFSVRILNGMENVIFIYI